MVQFYPWFKFYLLLFLGIVMYDNEFETKENKIWTKDKIKPQHIYIYIYVLHKVNLTDPAILLKFLGGKREVGKTKSTASETQEWT